MIDIVLILIVICIIGLSAVFGLKAGFLRTLIGMLSLVIGIVIVTCFNSCVSDWITDHTSFRDFVYGKIYDGLSEDVNAASADTVEEVQGVLEESFFPSVILETFNEKISARLDADGYLKNASMFMANKAVSALGIVITILLAWLIIKIVLLLTGALTKLPVIHGVDRTLGIVIGTVRGLVLVWLFCWVVTIFSFTDLGQKCVDAMSSNKFLGLFYNGTLSIGSILKF